MKFLLHNWYRLGIILGLVGLIITISLGHVNQVQLLLIINLVCLTIHQFEEYQLPGGAPVIINRTIYGETTRANYYPGNSLSIMVVNVSAWVIYAIAIAFYQHYWLGLGVILFSLFQILGHCIEMPLKLRAWYNPGMATSIFLFLPTGLVFIRILARQGCLSGATWLGAVLTLLACILITIVAPVQLLKNENTNYPIAPWQVKRFELIMQKCQWK